MTDSCLWLGTIPGQQRNRKTRMPTQITPRPNQIREIKRLSKVRAWQILTLIPFSSALFGPSATVGWLHSPENAVNYLLSVSTMKCNCLEIQLSLSGFLNEAQISLSAGREKEEECRRTINSLNMNSLTLFLYWVIFSFLMAPTKPPCQKHVPP